MKKFLLFLFTSSYIFAKDINVGDLVQFKIEGINREEIVKSIEKTQLQLEEIKEDKDGYLISVRSFKVGDSEILLGNKRILLNVKSVLEESDKEIYPHLSNNEDKILFSSKFPYLFIISTIIGLLSLGYLIKNIKFNKKIKTLTPEEKFQNTLNNLSEKDWDFQLSMAIREYIDNKYKSHFKNGIYFPIGKIDLDDVEFINNLDRNKFSNNNEVDKDEVINRITKIFNKLKEEKKDV